MSETDLMSPNIVEVSHFKMSFGAKEVIRDLSFEVKRGEIFGFLGSNGSGKTTTIRALLGIYTPTGGTLHINGKVFNPNSLDTIVGYLPEERGLYRKEIVLDTMLYFAKLKGLKQPRAWIETYLKRVDLLDKLHEKIEKLSGGQQQKIQLGVTIMGDPSLLILDEPTKGFDPVNRKLLMDIIDELHAKGTSVILTTHMMEEAARICDHILLLKDGVARAYGTVAEIYKEFNSKSLEDIFLRVYGVKSNEQE